MLASWDTHTETGGGSDTMTKFMHKTKDCDRSNVGSTPFLIMQQKSVNLIQNQATRQWYKEATFLLYRKVAKCQRVVGYTPMSIYLQI